MTQMPEPLIITCALVGAELTRKVYPPLPLSPDEIAVAAEAAVKAGAHIIHLHVRDEAGLPSQRVDLFEAVTHKIRSRIDCILQFSTGGAVGTPLNERIAPLTAVTPPEMATLSMGTLNFGTRIYENTEKTILAIAEAIYRQHILPELEIFDGGMLETAFCYLRQELLRPPLHINFVLGVPFGMGGSIQNLIHLTTALPSGQTWTVAGIGACQLPLAAHAIAMGGHVRVGIEDNIYFRKGEPAQSNAQLVKRVVRLANELERPIANMEEARQILHLRPKPNTSST